MLSSGTGWKVPVTVFLNLVAFEVVNHVFFRLDIHSPSKLTRSSETICLYSVSSIQPFKIDSADSYLDFLRNEAHDTAPMTLAVFNHRKCPLPLQQRQLTRALVARKMNLDSTCSA